MSIVNLFANSLGLLHSVNCDWIRVRASQENEVTLTASGTKQAPA